MELFKKVCPFGHIGNCNPTCALFDEDTELCGLLRVARKEKKEKVLDKTPKLDIDEVLEYFCDAYKRVTDNDYRVTKTDFINIARLLKDVDKVTVKLKIDMMKTLIGSVWFMSTPADFNVGKLCSQFNSIIIDHMPGPNTGRLQDELREKGLA